VNRPGWRSIHRTVLFGRPVLTVVARITGSAQADDLRLLSDAEREHLRGIAGPLWQREHAAGRALARRVVGQIAGIRPRLVQLGIDERGRPYVDWRATPGCPPGLDVNVSHSGGLVALAVGTGVRVGVDLERHTPRPAADALARRYFSSAEYERLKRTPQRAYLQAWYRIWTTREAHAKAVGVGVWGICASLDRHGRRWQLIRPAAPGGFTLSVVALRPGHDGRTTKPATAHPC
jgi:4'-phosphopantetheinyl transferase